MFAEHQYADQELPCFLSGPTALCIQEDKEGFQWSTSLFLGTLSFQETLPYLLKHKHPGL